MKKYLLGTFISMAAFLLFFDDAFASLDIGEFLMDSDSTSGSSSGQGDVFGNVAVRMIRAVADLRIFAYIIAGFGMIAFTWGAIFNKINWKHFGNIMFSLFILSMMIPLIEMVVYGDNGQKLKFGGKEATYYVPNGDHEAYSYIDYEHIDRLEPEEKGFKVDPAKASDVEIKLSGNPQSAVNMTSKMKFKDALNKTKETADKIREGVKEIKQTVDTGIKIATAAGTIVRGATQAANTIKNVSQAADAIMKDPNASGWDKFNAVLGATSSSYDAVNGAYSQGLGSTMAITEVFDPYAAQNIGEYGSMIQGIVSEIPGAAIGGAVGLRDSGNEIQSTVGYIQETAEGAASVAR